MNQQNLPNATVVLVLGILSIVTCFCYGVVGIILGAIALFLAAKDRKLYAANPTGYSNYSMLNTGRILSIVGIILSVLYLVLVIAVISIFGMEGMQDRELMEERINEYFGVQ